jgi:hypothetical protein
MYGYKKYLLLVIIVAISVSAWFYASAVTNSNRIVDELKLFQIDLQQKAKDSKKIEKKTFGSSVKGRPIDGYEIGNGSHTLLLIGSIHGNEMGTSYLLERFVEELKANPDLISRTKKLVIIPIANPDGFYDRIDKLNANNVNLDLNFATTDWQEYGLRGDWAGPEPFSEPESRVLKQIIEEYKPDAMISFHARGAFVSPEVANTPSELGKWYADKTGYVYDDDIEEWNFAGTSTRWFVETTGKAVITVELTKYLESDWEINKDALLELVSSKNPLPSS